eukprot:CAMPEP_0180135478 /NCGR_PEP_ID=MMETSP0986-20121125/10869_1 /TAXON_ID=697907 /ORGANISM="non described non described, Strain CCMP2293" /LENGTH=64 /DNA_ID=CAMNT_0022076213 /DNA_START=186 /DNA_END=380 /DNA_ORIENTATION=-
MVVLGGRAFLMSEVLLYVHGAECFARQPTLALGPGTTRLEQARRLGMVARAQRSGLSESAEASS